MTIQPISEQTHPIGSGTQKIYRFDNGYGASVIQFEIAPGVGSYGAAAGRWELAVLKFDSDGYDLTYETPITDDVLGHLDDEEVQETLAKIRDLPTSSIEAAAR